ncbi:hypothetical protein [Streptomyces sp. NPDC047009]|uniref:hypothetical protein n=1 Tax=Streptomyces sp. NPDC047009 TaxID=3154496 RepID=UPI0033C67A69
MTVLALGYQRILGVLEERRSAGKGPVKAKEIAAELGLETTLAKVEGVRSKARRAGRARVARTFRRPSSEGGRTTCDAPASRRG